MSKEFRYLLLGILVFSPLSYGVDCYEESRLFLAQGDEYFDIDKTVTLTRKEKKSLRSLSESVKGEWKGSATFTDCRGPQRSMKPKSQHFTIKSKVERGSGQIIRLRMDKKSNRKSVLETINFFDEKLMSAYTEVGSSYQTNEKFRTRSIPNQARLIERSTTFEKKGKTLKISIKSYINGSFANLQTIELKKI